MKLIHGLYIILIIILATFLYAYIQEIKPFSLKEGARTYPMPRRHPLTFEYGTFQNEGQGNLQSLNVVIDSYISRYFDENGVPYMNTIEDVQNFVAGKATPKVINGKQEFVYTNGTISPMLKSKITDIGYYFLEIVIPMLPTTQNPKPKVQWPPLKWSGLQGFDVEVADTKQCKVYEGAPEDNFKYVYNMNKNNNWMDSLDNMFDDIFDDNIGIGTSGTDGSSATSSTGTSGTGDSSNDCNDSSECCGIQCPQQCFEKALGITPAPAPSSSGSGNTSGYIGGLSDVGNNTNNGSSISYAKQVYQNTGSSLTYKTDIRTICPHNLTGYDITYLKVEQDDINKQTLKNQIYELIKTYFEQDKHTPNELVPTKEFIELFHFYSTDFSPMDDYHMELLRNLVFYVLQVIVPGMPTPSVPYYYVQWRPFTRYQG